MTTAPSVTLVLPSVVAMVVDTKRIATRGNTVVSALRSAFEQFPQLERHLMTESGKIRPHVLCVVNGSVVPREKAPDFRLEDGDELLIHQAISGG